MVRRGLFFIVGFGFCCGFFLLHIQAEKSKSPVAIEATGLFVELLSRFELETSSLPRMRSTD